MLRQLSIRFVHRQCEDPDFWRTVRDPATGQDVVLSKEDLELISRIRQGQVPNSEHDEYEVRVAFVSFYSFALLYDLLIGTSASHALCGAS